MRNKNYRITHFIHTFYESIPLWHQRSFYSHDLFPCKHGQTINNTDMKVLVYNVNKTFLFKKCENTVTPKVEFEECKTIWNKSFPIKILFGIPLTLMPQRPSSSRTHHSAPYRPDSVIEDLA